MLYDSKSTLHKKSFSGFTLIEIILVIAIMAIISVSAAPFLSRFLTQNRLEVSTDKVISTIRKTQSYAMSGKDNSIWGFCKSGNNIRLFKGSCATPAYNEDFDLSKVTISGLTEVVFTGMSGKRGEPNTPVTVTIANDIGSNTVSINYAGGLTIN